MSARRRLLRMVAEGRLEPEEALTLWDALAPEEGAAPVGVPDGAVGEAPSPSEEAGPPGWFRALPWGLAALGALLLLGVGWAVFLAGAGLLLTLLCLTPLGLLGLLALALAWAGWRGVWLMLEVRQPPGETPQRLRLAFPLPLAWVPWALRLARPWVDAALPLDGVVWRQVLRVLREEPLWLAVDDADGTQVRVWIGRTSLTKGVSTW